MLTSHRDRVADTMARATTPVLITSLRTLEALPDRKQEEAMARAWIMTELEARFPAASDAVEAAFEAAEEQDPPAEVDYVAVLLAHIPADA